VTRKTARQLSKFNHGQRRQAIVQALLTEVVQGRLRAGQRLVTQELAGCFRVSHTPIREALIELAGMGVVTLLPNRGALVHHLTAREVREMCQVRRVLECAAVRRACGRIDTDALAEIAEDIRRLTARPREAVAVTIRQARTVDSRLHDLISASCGNAFLAKEISRLTILFRAFRDVAWEREQARNDLRRIPEEAKEHLAVVEALLAGDRAGAARAMGRHIRSGAAYWCRTMAAAPEPNTPVNPSRNGTRSNGR
jgi:DNA-binding GntR family transcriptional regulator